MRSYMVGLAVLAAMAIAGCGSDEPETPEEVQAQPQEEATEIEMVEREVTAPARPKPEETVAGPVEYIDTVLTIGEWQKYKIKRFTVEQAVQYYHAQREEYPSSVEDLVKEGLLMKAPSLEETDRWVIDPETGRVAIMRRVPKRPAAAGR